MSVEQKNTAVFRRTHVSVKLLCVLHGKTALVATKMRYDLYRYTSLRVMVVVHNTSDDTWTVRTCTVTTPLVV